MPPTKYPRILEYDPNWIGEVRGPDDPPGEMDVIRLPVGGWEFEEKRITSTRLIILAQEIPGGALGDDFGFVCADNTKANATPLTLPGGRVEPPANEQVDPDFLPAEETIRQCMIREALEEVLIDLSGSNILLFGLRPIMEGSEPVLHRGLPAVDAYFLAIATERLGYAMGFAGETGLRHVVPIESLIKETPRGERPPIPQTQAIGLASGIVMLHEIYKERLPDGVRSVCERSLAQAEAFIGRSRWGQNFIRVRQQEPWTPR